MLIQGEIPYGSGLFPVMPHPSGRVCWEDEELLRGYTWEHAIQQVPVTSGVGVGVGAGDVDGGELIGQFTFQLPVGTPTTVRHHVFYPALELNRGPLPLRHIALLDERQIPAGPGDDPFWDVTLDPGDQAQFEIPLPALEAGIHELVVILLGFHLEPPDEYGWSNNFISRTTLIVGEPPLLLPRAYRWLAPDALISGDSNLGLEMMLDPVSRRVWNWPERTVEVLAGDALTFFVDVGYESSVNDDFPDLRQPAWQPSAILGFLDYQQIDGFLEIGTPYVAFSSETLYSTLEAHLPAPEELGRHDLMLIKINFPGFPECILRGGPESLVFSDWVDLQRVAIEVVPAP